MVKHSEESINEIDKNLERLADPDSTTGVNLSMLRISIDPENLVSRSICSLYTFRMCAKVLSRIRSCRF